MDFPKLPKNNIDLSTVLTKLDDVGNLSDEAKAILLKINSNVEKTRASSSNKELIELKRENDVIEDLIKNVSDEKEQQKLNEVLDSLQDSIRQNSSVMKYYFSQFRTSVSAFTQKNMVNNDLNTLFKTINDLKEESINSLPPFWKGLVNIGRDVYKERQDRKNRVYNDVNNNYQNALSTNSNSNFSDVTNNNEQFFQEMKDNIQTITKNTELIAPEKKESFNNLESEETYKRETVKNQRDTNEVLEKIYKFLTGNEFFKKFSNEDDKGIISNILDFGKDLLIGKFLLKLGKSNIGSKFLNTKIGQIFKEAINPKVKTDIIDETVKTGKTPDKNVINSDNYKKDVSSTSKETNKPSTETNTEKTKKLVDDNSIKTNKDVTKNVTKDVVTDSVKKDVIKTVEKDVAKNTVETVTKNTAKSAAKSAAKSTGKTILKKIPIIGLIASGLFGLQRFLEGDTTGAAMELASGAASTLPGLGTVVSTMIDTGLTVRDIKKNNESDDNSSESNSFNDISVSNKNSEEVFNNKTDRNMVYTQNNTRMNTDMIPSHQQTPTVINNYNTTNNNVSQNRPLTPQMLVNPVNPNTWQGNGWSGAR